MPASSVVSRPALTLDQVLAEGLVRSHYQPIVDLASGGVVAYEALARGPEGSPLEPPGALFAAARAVGRLADLERACQAAALRGAAMAGMRLPLRLFVNVEPEVLEDEAALLGDAEVPSGLGVVVEFTERELTARPAELLRTVAAIRERGWGIALDDVGADRHSLALMPLLRPDVIKLDLRLVQARPSPGIAEIVHAVGAQAERSGATVLAEGIETQEHMEIAHSLGATLGQGWHFGRPAPLSPSLPCPALTVPLLAAPTLPPVLTPWAAIEGRRGIRRSRKPLLLAMTRWLEQQAAELGEAGVVVATFQHDRYLGAATRERYRQLAQRSALVAVLGKAIPPVPASGVRGAVLDAGDPLVREWDVVVVGPHVAAALVARDLGDDVAEDDRRFDYVLTYDRDLVLQVLASLLDRVTPRALPGAG